MPKPKKELALDCELPTPMHCNGHVICAIDTETTGLKAGFNDLVQVAVVVLDHEFKPNKAIMPFYTDLKPLRPENAHPKAFVKNGLSLAKLTNDGLDAWKAGDLFIEWFEKLNLRDGKKIMPLGFNYDFDKSFLIEWLGPETYDQLFDHNPRDGYHAVSFLNDKMWWKADPIKFPKKSLAYVAKQLGIVTQNSHDALADAVTAAEVWRRLLTGVPV